MRTDLPVYARALRLRHLRPGGILCFMFFEGAIVVGVLLALAELVSWWSVPVLPVAVAVMVKVNDVVARASVPAVNDARPPGQRGAARGRLAEHRHG